MALHSEQSYTQRSRPFKYAVHRIYHFNLLSRWKIIRTITDTPKNYIYILDDFEFDEITFLATSQV